VLTTLLNDITAISDQFVLVLDDYHLIDAKPVDQILTYLIEHPPPQMHLVIATREDSHLSLARLRARDHVTELRAADLRFTPAEAADFLTQVMGLHLSAEDITRWDGAPKAGLSVCNWRLFPCKDSQMPPDCMVKGHNLSIFGKLQVQRRTEAVARARELGLL
jgi:ATP/maltotriose-dependent transcriptional regulator MalT